jgi:putative FmdB family regulatory protein
MPHYDYQCNHCQTVFEVQAMFKEKEVGLEPECPQCHGKETQQLLSTGLLIRFGGNGVSLTMSACGPNAGPGCCG